MSEDYSDELSERPAQESPGQPFDIEAVESLRLDEGKEASGGQVKNWTPIPSLGELPGPSRSPTTRSIRWNIFARELEDILAARGLRFSHLQDRGVVYYREKVRRFQHSLTSPNYQVTLNPEEMERLIAIMQLTEVEQLRLRAALLATAVEMVLMDRVDPETALMASDDVFNILFAAMRAQPDSILSRREVHKSSRSPTTRSIRWNIFARELEDILAARGLRFSHLQDRGVVYYREKVRRFQHSLTSPEHLTTLNPEEMERLGTIMQLTDDEQKQLRAALLATAVEMVLMDRVDPETALMASDDVFNILFAAMRAQPDGVVAASVR